MERTPQEIADGLSEAQRRAMTLSGAADYYGRHEVFASGETLASLIALGLCGDSWDDRMTDLGEQVRAILKEKEG